MNKASRGCVSAEIIIVNYYKLKALRLFAYSINKNGVELYY